MRGFTLPLLLLASAVASVSAVPLPEPQPQGVAQFNTPASNNGGPAPNIVNGQKQPVTAPADDAAAPANAKAPADAAAPAPSKAKAKPKEKPDDSSPLSMLKKLPVLGTLLPGKARAKRQLPVPVVGPLLGNLPVVNTLAKLGSGGKVKREDPMDFGKLLSPATDPMGGLAEQLPTLNDVKKAAAIVADIRGVTSKRSPLGIPANKPTVDNTHDLSGDLNRVGNRINRKLGPPELPKTPTEHKLAAHGLDKRMDAWFDSILLRKRANPSPKPGDIPAPVADELQTGFGGEELADNLTDSGDKISEETNEHLGPAKVHPRPVDAKLWEHGLGKRESSPAPFQVEDYQPDEFMTESLRSASLARDSTAELVSSLDRIGGAGGHYRRSSVTGLEKTSAVTAVLDDLPEKSPKLPGLPKKGKSLPGLDSLGGLGLLGAA